MGFRQMVSGKRAIREERRRQRVKPRNVPEEIARMRITSARRLMHIDKYVIRVGGFDKSRPVKFLDVGCCPMVDGAPTTISTKKEFKKAGFDMDILAVDKFFSNDFKSSDSKIKYEQLDISKTSLTEKFDLVRASSVFEYIQGAENIAHTRDSIIKSVREGGILIINFVPGIMANLIRKNDFGAALLVLKKVNGEMVLLKPIEPQSTYRSKRAGYIK